MTVSPTSRHLSSGPCLTLERVNYQIDRVFQDDAGFLYREHRPGYMRRDGAPVVAATEHPITPNLTLTHMIDPGSYVIVEEPW